MDKKHKHYLKEFEPPSKKLVSEGDLLIKQLVEKQKCTKTTLVKELAREKEFERVGELIPITSYHSGECSTQKIQQIENSIKEIDSLKDAGLSKEDIDFYQQYLSNNLSDKHKNYEPVLLEERINRILNLLNQRTNATFASNDKTLGKNHETALVTKPDSIETKLLEFALNNEKKAKPIPHPMDEIKEYGKKLTNIHTDDIKIEKIRRKARKLSRRLQNGSKEVVVAKEICSNSKWDLKTDIPSSIAPKKVYTCLPQKLYTIKNGAIVALKSANVKEETILISNERLSIEEIKKLAKFEEYSIGITNNILYLKNLPKNIKETDLEKIFALYWKDCTHCRLMAGRMKGQAFLTFKDEHIAAEVLSKLNGILLNGAPMVIEFGKNKKDSKKTNNLL